MHRIPLTDLATIIYVLVDDWWQTHPDSAQVAVGRPSALSVSDMLTLLLLMDVIPFPSERSFYGFLRANYPAFGERMTPISVPRGSRFQDSCKRTRLIGSRLLTMLLPAPLRLIGCILHQWIIVASIWADPERSMVKAVAIIQDYVGDLARAHRCPTMFTDILAEIAQALRHLARLQRRKKRPSSAQRIMRLDPG